MTSGEIPSSLNLYTIIYYNFTLLNVEREKTGLQLYKNT